MFAYIFVPSKGRFIAIKGEREGGIILRFLECEGIHEPIKYVIFLLFAYIFVPSKGGFIAIKGGR